MVGPSRLDLRPDSGSADAQAAFRARLSDLLARPPAWSRPAPVPEAELARVPVGPALVIGFGGSALGTRAALAFAGACARVRVLDSLDVDEVTDAFAWARACAATLIVVTKSGGTVEVLELARAALEQWPGARVLVSDPTPGQADALLATAGDHLRFTMPAEVGGRYSVLTAVGQVPLRAAGLPPHALLLGARTEAARLAERGDPVVEWSSWRAAHPADAMVLWSYAHPVAELAAWWQQLECESLGKTRPDGRRTGELVTLLRGPADQHSVAQLLLEGATSCRVVVLDLAAEPAPAALREVSRLRSTERDATFDAMVRPSARLLVIDRTLETLGAAMLQLMFATVAWADHLGVDPYGQPAVEAIKKRVVARRGGASG